MTTTNVQLFVIFRLSCIVMMASASVTDDGLVAMETTGSPEITSASQIMTTSDFQDTSSVAQGDGRFCNKSLTYTVKTECKPCAVNAMSSCPLGLIQLTQVSIYIAYSQSSIDIFHILNGLSAPEMLCIQCV